MRLHPFALLLALATTPLAAQGDRARTIVTTDGEIDDVDSYVRMLLYANEFDVEGLVYSSSMWHYAGDGVGTTMTSAMPMTRDMYGERADLRWPGTAWMGELLDAYAEVYPSLRRHDARYPAPDSLRAVVRVGNVDFEGAMSEDTEGSNLIRAELLETLADDADPRPLYLQAWGGVNTIARALKSIEEEFGGRDDWPVLRKRIAEGAILYLIAEQDATYRDYIAPHWPELPVLLNARQFWAMAYGWRTAVPDTLHPYLEGEFMGEHVIRDHGPLTAMYYSYGDGQRQAGDPEHVHGDPTRIDSAQWGSFGVYDFISEGDSPAFLHLVDVGLGGREHPSWGNWGGRLLPVDSAAGMYADTEAAAEYNPLLDTLDAHYALTRWLPDFQRDLAARADWCVLPYAEANHPPRVELDGERERRVRPGEEVRLSAKTSDPDGDALDARWWRYAAADTYPGQLTGEHPLADTYRVPDDLAPGESIHLVLSVTDDGEPALTRYARVVLVGEAP